MSKPELIEQIRRLNATAQPEFLASFDEEDLIEYLGHLKEVERDRRRQERLELLATA